MFEIIVFIVFIWLMIKTIGLALKLTWSFTKVIAGILIGLALPVLIICLVFASGVFLLIPIAVIGIALGILKACV